MKGCEKSRKSLLDKCMEKVDCLLIGHNEMEFCRYEKLVRVLGIYSEAYRDLQLSFIVHRGRNYTFPDLFNEVALKTKYYKDKKFEIGNVFSAAIASLGSFLNKQSLSFDYVNSFSSEKNKIKNILQSKKVYSIGITTTFYTSSIPIIEIINYIRAIDSNVKIILGGPFVLSQIESKNKKELETLFKKLGADFYIYSAQGELALSQLIKHIKGEIELEDVHNIFYIRNNGLNNTLLNFENNKLEENLIDWSLFRSQDIGYNVNLRTTISCPFSCAFCAFPKHAGKYQVTNVSTVEKMLDDLSKISSVKTINFIDDTYNMPLNRFKEILRMMIRKEYNFTWNSYIRCQYLDEEALDLMKKSKCAGVFLGLESANQRILNNMNKRVKVEEYARGIQLLKKYDIPIFCSFIVGFPGEDYESINDTINFIKEYKPDYYRLSLWYCDPITPIYQQRQYNIEGSQFAWKHFSMNSKEAITYIEEAFLKLHDSIWMPQYGFDFISIFNLINRGLSVEQINNLLRLFNNEIRIRLLNQLPYDNIVGKFAKVLNG